MRRLILLAIGYGQIQSIDSNETYVLMKKVTTIRLLLALTSIFNM